MAKHLDGAPNGDNRDASASLTPGLVRDLTRWCALLVVCVFVTLLMLVLDSLAAYGLVVATVLAGAAALSWLATKHHGATG